MARNNLLLFLIFLLFFNLCFSVNLLKINTTTLQIVDNMGRERYFHGTNAVVKTPPYIPYTDSFDACNSLVDTDFQFMKDQGFNVIRLGVMWPGVEPSRGQFNQTYLNEVEKIINNAGKYGIYTLIDMHQDLFSEKFCGDGVPMWVLEHDDFASFPSPIRRPEPFDNKTGLPTNCYSQLGWAAYYGTFDVMRGFEKLYQNKKGWRDLFVRYWSQVSQRFAQNEYVLAYQLLNEPWPGNFYKDVLVGIPGIAEKVHLQKLYDLLNTAIRKNDPDRIIFFEPVTWDQIIPTGFTHPPGGKDFRNRSVFAYHYYKPPDISEKKFIKARVKDSKRLGVGGFLTQFFIIGGDFPESSVKVMDQLDKYQQGWMGWLYKPFNSNKCSGTGNYSMSGLWNADDTVNHKLVWKLRRTYPQIVAGKTLSFQFIDDTAQFSFCYLICPECGQTIVYYHPDQYYYNKQFTLVGNAKYEEIDTHHISITANQNSTQSGEQICAYMIRQTSTAS